MTKHIDVETRTMLIHSICLFSLTHFTHHSTLTNREKKKETSSLSMRAHESITKLLNERKKENIIKKKE